MTRIMDVIEAAPPRISKHELAYAAAFIREGRTHHPARVPPPNGKPLDGWQQIRDREQQARVELLEISDQWRRLDLLTPWQMTILMTVAVEGNAGRAADRLCITRQTLKNHMTNIRRVVYGRFYSNQLGGRTSIGPLVAMAVRWALDHEQGISDP